MCFAQWLCHHHRSRSYLRVRRNKNKLRPPATLDRSTAGYFPSLRSATITSLRLIQHTKYPRHQIGRNQYAKRSLQNDSAYSAPPMSGAHTCSTHSRECRNRRCSPPPFTLQSHIARLKANHVLHRNAYQQAYTVARDQGDGPLSICKCNVLVWFASLAVRR